MSLQANISNTPFDQKFFRPSEVGVLQWHTHTNKQTYKQTDIADSRLNQPRADSVKIPDNLLYLFFSLFYHFGFETT